jgi:N-acetylmuramic acid 6-phosphate etherase
MENTTPFAKDSVSELLISMHEGDATLAASIDCERLKIRSVIDMATATIAAGGRLIYIGTGTSGRMGVLDAVELGPTFGVYQDQVLAIIAGGTEAMVKAVEGAEDDGDAAIQDLNQEQLSEKDLLIGISASGKTAYTRRALEYARKMGTQTFLITGNTTLLEDEIGPIIFLDVGEEVIKGSTRLKAGTAQKMVLNMISTGTMVSLGKTFGSYMTHVSNHNHKLKNRQIEILEAVLSVDRSAAKAILKQTNGNVNVGILMGKKNMTLNQALKQLELHQGNLNKALDIDDAS